jgi:dipeptidyl-peptidase-4
MQDLGKDFELMMYPGERHGWGGSKRMHLNKLVNKFWDEQFFGAARTKMIQP